MQKTAPSIRRLRKPERRKQILMELKLKPHVRVSELADQFDVTTETIRRDMEELSGEGLLSRAYGGASATPVGAMRTLDERSRDRVRERERIGRFAASMVQPGNAVFIDAGSTTLQLARYLAFNGTRLTAITNCLQVAMALGQSSEARVLMCPGDYLAAESAVVGTETVEFIERHHADLCFIGAAGLSAQGVSEAAPGFAPVKRAMMRRCPHTHLLIDSNKFGHDCLNVVSDLQALQSIVVDRPPDGALQDALDQTGATVFVAAPD